MVSSLLAAAARACVVCVCVCIIQHRVVVIITITSIIGGIETCKQRREKRKKKKSPARPKPLSARGGEEQVRQAFMASARESLRTCSSPLSFSFPFEFPNSILESRRHRETEREKEEKRREPLAFRLGLLPHDPRKTNKQPGTFIRRPRLVHTNTFFSLSLSLSPYALVQWKCRLLRLAGWLADWLA